MGLQHRLDVDSDPIWGLGEQSQLRTGLICYFLLGAGLLAPWNAFISAVDYFESVFGAQVHIDRSFTLCYLPTCTVLIAITLRWRQARWLPSPHTRIKAAFSAFTLLMVVVPIVDAIGASVAGSSSGPASPPPGSLVAVLATVVLIGLLDGLCQGAVFGDAATLPSQYTQAVVAGTASSGLLICMLRILTKLSWAHTSDGVQGATQMTAALRTSTAVYFLLASTLSAACLVGFTFVLPQLPALQRLRLSPTAAAAVGGGGPVNVKAVQLSAVHRPQQDDLAGSCVDDEEALSDEEQGGGGSGEAGAGVPLLGKHDDAGIAASGASRGGGVIPISATSASSLRLPRGANATAGVPAGSYTAAAGHNRSAKGQPATGAWGQGAGLLRPAPRSGAGAGVREYEDDIEDEMLTLDGLLAMEHASHAPVEQHHSKLVTLSHQHSMSHNGHQDDGMPWGHGIRDQGPDHHHGGGVDQDQGRAGEQEGLLSRPLNTLSSGSAAWGEGGFSSLEVAGGAERSGALDLTWPVLVACWRRLWALCLTLFITYSTTLSIFPGFLAEDVRSEDLGSWYPILLITAFNASDLAGKSLPITSSPHSLGGPASLLTIALIRMAVCPPAFYAAARLEAPPWLMGLLTVGLGASNGWLTAAAMTRGPLLLAAPAPSAPAINTCHSTGAGTGVQGWRLQRSSAGASSGGGGGKAAGSSTPTRRALFRTAGLTAEEAFQMGPALLSSGGDGLLVLSLLTGLTAGACLGWLWLLGHR